MAKLNLKKFLAEHYKSGVSVRDVIREAVMNSIHAGATSVVIDLAFTQKGRNFFPGSEDKKFLESVTITDDGEGFTSQNLAYFDEICTSHKDNIGGKGVGRLSFLKFAKKVLIRSQLESEVVEFSYTPDFTSENVTRKPTPKMVSKKATSIFLSDLRSQVNTQVAKLINFICDDFRLILFLKAKQGINIELKFTHSSGQSFSEEFFFRGQEITALSDKEFSINDESFKCYLFRDESPKKGITVMLCADELCVEDYQLSRKFDACRYCIFVTSGYFNSRSNLERQRLDIPRLETDIDLVSPISREVLIPKINGECMAMISEISDSGISEFKNNNIARLKKYYPFINIDSIGGNAAFIDAEQMVQLYRAQQARKEDSIVDELDNGGTISFDIVSQLASDDLARYIVHRALVIDSLANTPADSAEEAIHNAILPKKSSGNDVGTNNIWLVDDKFLAYSSIYSDETLSKIASDVTDSFALKHQHRPDVAAFFSKDNEENPNKLVVVEFKKPSADLFENTKALTQCRYYASLLTDKIPTILEVFAFAILNVDDELYRELKQTNYKDIFSLKDRVLYQDFNIGEKSTVLLHLYVMPPAALIKDAKARNKVFEDILQLGSPLC